MYKKNTQLSSLKLSRGRNSFSSLPPIKGDTTCWETLRIRAQESDDNIANLQKELARPNESKNVIIENQGEGLSIGI